MERKRFLVLSLLLVLVLLPPASAYGTPADGSVKWIFSAGSPVDSSPAIGADGTIYVASWEGIVYALNPDDGSVKWGTATGGLMSSSPAIGADGTIYIGISGTTEPLDFYTGKVYALNPADGSVKWTFTCGYPIPSSAAIGADGTIFIGSEDRRIYALNPGDGSLKWKFDTESRVNNSPAIGADGTVYAGNLAFYALNPADGSEKWSFAYGSKPAIGADGTIYLSCDSDFAALSADGSLKWRIDIPSNSVPAIDRDGIVYFGAYDGKVYAINSGDGSQKWSFATGALVQSSPAIGADGTVFIGSYDNNIYALNPDGSMKWSFNTGDGVYSSPAIGADGTIYVGSRGGRVYALNSSCGGLAESPWPKFGYDARNTSRVCPTAFFSVAIDIKPGEDPNIINRKSKGNVPVAIFSTEEFDATQIDPASVTLSAARVLLKGKSGPYMTSVKELNGDGLLDLLVHVETTALQLSEGDIEAVLEGKTYGGLCIRGTDTIRITPERTKNQQRTIQGRRIR